VVRRFAPSFVVPLVLLVSACDSGGGGGGGATTSATDATSGSDTATGADATATTTTTSSPDTNTGGGDHSGFTASSSNFDSESGFALFQAMSSSAEPTDILQIEIYTGGQYEGAADGPGTYALDGSNYATCGNCVVIRTACTADGGCDKRFYADEGDLVITQWDEGGGRFTGTLQGVVLHEVTIDEETYESTPVPGGETWTLDNFAFDAEVKALPVSDKTQAECVAEGTGNLLHDNVANLTLKNCLGEDVQLHATCGGESEALWLIGTTGWCTACHEFLEAFRLKHGNGELTRALVSQKTAGLDMLIILAENNDGEEPTQAFCQAYAEDMKIDPHMVVIDWTRSEVESPLIDPEGYSIPTQALGNTWRVINPYLQADSQGSVTTAYPWWALLKAPNMEYVWSDGGAVITFDEALESLLGRFPDELFE